MSSFKEIFKAELKQIIDNHSILLTVIIAPLLYASLLGSIYIRKDIQGISFGIVDNDYTATTLKLTRMLSARSVSFAPTSVSKPTGIPNGGFTTKAWVADPCWI